MRNTDNEQTTPPRFGAFGGADWGLLGVSWGPLEVLWGPLVAEGPKRPSGHVVRALSLNWIEGLWSHLGNLLGHLGGRLGAILGRLGGLLGRLGATLGASWAVLERREAEKREIPKPSKTMETNGLSIFGPFGEASWGVLEASWAVLEAPRPLGLRAYAELTRS